MGTSIDCFPYRGFPVTHFPYLNQSGYDADDDDDDDDDGDDGYDDVGDFRTKGIVTTWVPASTISLTVGSQSPTSHT